MSNMSSAISESIKVFVRQRPFLETSADSSRQDQYSSSDKKKSGIKSIGKDGRTCQYFSGGNNTSQTFTMDRCFSAAVTQDEIFETVAKPIIDSALLGYSGTILAYGPTSSGKTFTMRGGGGSNRGIMPRCIERLLAGSNGNTEIWASYLQIYCEAVTDLLYQRSDTNFIPAGGQSVTSSFESGKTTPVGIAGMEAGATGMDSVGLVGGQQLRPGTPMNLMIREKTDGKGVYVEGLSRYRISNVDDLWELLRRGDENRCTASTNMNETSSRSHAALLISIILPDGDGDCDGDGDGPTSDGAVADKPATSSTYRQSSLILVDLAGSERATATDGRGATRQEEAKAINLSLSALGNCMNALAEGRAHVPYRDAKLTRLLQGCLGGGARTAVVVNLCPGEDATGETLSALRFASRASKVKVVAKISRYQDYEAMYREAKSRIKLLEEISAGAAAEAQVKAQAKAIKEKDELIEQQAQEIANLKQQLQLLQSHYSAAPASPTRSGGSMGFSDAASASGTGGVRGVGGGEQGHAVSVVNIGGSSGVTTATTNLGETANDAEWTEKLNVLTQEHLQALEAAQRDFQYKLTKAKQAKEQAAREVLDLQDALNAEKNKRLESVQNLREISDKRFAEENALKSRIDELLSEVTELRDKWEDAVAQGTAAEDKVKELKAQIADMVTKEQVKEMEGLFVDTVKKLSDRVNILESGSGRRSAGSDGGIGAAGIGSSGAAGSGGSSAAGSGGRSVRMEPGKIRSGSSSTYNSNSYNNGSNIGRR